MANRLRLIGKTLIKEKRMPTFKYKKFEPHFSEKAVRFHFEGYYTALENNNCEAFDRIQEIKETGRGEALLDHYHAILRRTSGAIYNHKIFFGAISGISTTPEDELRQYVNEDFGSFASLRTQLIQAAKSIKGAGWVFLTLDPVTSRLKVLTTALEDSLPQIYKGHQALLAIDLWEHAYIMDFNTDIDSYVKRVWDCINWKTVYERLKIIADAPASSVHSDRPHKPTGCN